jgi:hypothetical protein
MRILTLISGFALVGPVFAQTPKAITPPIRVTLCEVTQNPSAYKGKRLVFRAQYITDHIERSVIFDDSCHGEGVLPYLREHAAGADSFNDAIQVMPPTHLKEVITATFTGTFHFASKPEMCMFLNKEVCRRSFEIEKVEDLVLTMTPTDDKDKGR